MHLILLRHGQAVDRSDWDGEDADRPLTKTGNQRTSMTLKALKGLIRGQEIWTSPWLRARTTAELASSIWKLPLREVSWLIPGAATSLERIGHLSGCDGAVLVGHEPDLGELIASCCGGGSVTLAKSAIAVLRGDIAPGGMSLQCLIGPKIALGLNGD